MRTFKFRAWIPKLKYFCKHVLFEDGVAVALRIDDDGFGYPIPADQCVIQQYTGLKDSVGVEIYEGDLVEFIYANQPDIEDSKGVYEVFYSQKDSAYYLRVHKKNWLDTSFVTQQDAKAKTIDVNCPVQSLTELPLSQFKICKVIGNIFENSEILK
jgi:uncharacterized phage protein (TIGR01671 family)